MTKKLNRLSRPIIATANLPAVCIGVLVLNGCSTSFQQADSFQRSFNEHAEGWLNLVALLTVRDDKVRNPHLDRHWSSIMNDLWP